MENPLEHKILKNHRLGIIFIGSALSTGLLVGSGFGLARSGPAGILLNYSIIGFVAFLVLSALGEMSSFAPMLTGAGGYASRFVDPALGFATGYCNALKYLLSTPNHLVAASLIMKFWVGDTVKSSAIVTVALIVVLIINLITLKAFGEFQFWLALLKMTLLCGTIVLMLIVALGGGPNRDRLGFRYWKNPGAFADFDVSGPRGRFYRAWSTMVHAAYAFGGTELVGVPVTERKNPRTAMAGAVRLTFLRIFSIFILSIFLLGMVVPYDTPKLAFASSSHTTAAASPFVAAVELANIKGLDHVINGLMLIFITATSTTDFFLATRTIYGIALDGKAPAILTRTNSRGTPVLVVVIPFLFSLLAYLSMSSNTQTVFSYLMEMIVGFSVLTWISILTTHIAFCRAVKIQNIPSDRFAYRAPFREWGSMVALVFLCIFNLGKGSELFTGKKFNYRIFIVQYIGIPFYLLCVFGYKIHQGTRRVRSMEADLSTGVSTIPYDEEKARKKEEDRIKLANATGLKRVYRRFLSWIF
ncbi:amino acid permease [Aspergillus affinis]|uniref:amino acid permease n=1 Tax=Aspergillus affinis TaxID=1070780 RepID=UPI0022FED2E6|nr:amino acid permease [Aspergillus affinis]KAI9037185.1 amino acid permease [Aspergillus affinis]